MTSPTKKPLFETHWTSHSEAPPVSRCDVSRGCSCHGRHFVTYRFFSPYFAPVQPLTAKLHEHSALTC